MWLLAWMGMGVGVAIRVRVMVVSGEGGKGKGEGCVARFSSPALAVDWLARALARREHVDAMHAELMGRTGHVDAVGCRGAGIPSTQHLLHRFNKRC